MSSLGEIITERSGSILDVAARVRSAEAKEAFTAFFDKHRTETR